MSTPTERLAALGVELPPVAAPVAAYVPAIRACGLVMTSGQLPSVDGRLTVTGVPDFTGQPQVANGASTLFVDVFGDAGQHVRSAVGVPVLPLDAPVEVELIVEPVGTAG